MLNKRIKELRIENKFSQLSLGNELNLSSQAISKWETGLSEPDSETIIKLSKLFNVDVNYLLGVTDFPTPYNSKEMQIPDEFKQTSTAFQREEFKNLSKEEVDELAKYSEFLKSKRLTTKPIEIETLFEVKRIARDGGETTITDTEEKEKAKEFYKDKILKKKKN